MAHPGGGRGGEYQDWNWTTAETRVREVLMLALSTNLHLALAISFVINHSFSWLFGR